MLSFNGAATRTSRIALGGMPSPAAIAKLQRGRDAYVADSAAGGNFQGAFMKLQRGRDAYVADRSGTSATSSRTPSFNGAATRTSRIDPRPSFVNSLTNLLQRGRDAYVADSGEPDAGHCRRPCFNGAATRTSRIVPAFAPTT